MGWTNFVRPFVYNGVINNGGSYIMKRDNGNYGAGFQWLNNEIEVEAFHDKYYSAETLSMSLDDLKAMISGKYLTWTFEEKEYSHVLYLEDPAKIF